MPQTRLVPRSKTKYINKILSLFGSSLIGYWPLNERSGSVAYDWSGNNRHGAYTGVDLGQAGIGDRQTCPYFDGVNDYVSLYSTSLRDAFNPLEGSMLIWQKPLNSTYWSDGLYRWSLKFGAVSNNNCTLYKTSTNSYKVYYMAGGTSKSINIATPITTGFWSTGLSWSKSNDRVRGFLDGIQQGTTLTGLGVWTGSLSSDSCTAGAGSTIPTYVFPGFIGHAILLNREATPAEMLMAGRL